LLLWFRPNEKRSFARKASCGATLLIRKTRQPPSTSKFVAETIIFKSCGAIHLMPQTVADDFSIYQI